MSSRQCRWPQGSWPRTPPPCSPPKVRAESVTQALFFSQCLLQSASDSGEGARGLTRCLRENRERWTLCTFLSLLSRTLLLVPIWTMRLRTTCFLSSPPVSLSSLPPLFFSPSSLSSLAGADYSLQQIKKVAHLIRLAEVSLPQTLSRIPLFPAFASSPVLSPSLLFPFCISLPF